MKKKIEEIMKKFEGFTDGVRVLLLLQRNKEGGNNRRDKGSLKRLVSKNQEEFRVCLEKMFAEVERFPDLPLRIYSSVNPRNVEKAIRLFKFEQLEADFYDDDSRHNFYYDVRNRWVGVIASGGAKAGSNFLIDLDDMKRQNVESVMEALKTRNIEVLMDYPTKHGHHIITKPFNPNDLPNLDIKTDGMLLLHF